MAKNMFQADLGDINTSAAEFTREGVVDTSAKYDTNLQTLMEVADVAYTKYSEYDASKQLKDMEKQQVQDALAFKEHGGKEGLDKSIAGLEKEKQALFLSAKKEDQEAAANIESEIGRLKNAREQGGLSQTAYDIKVSSLVKQMSANKPWLASYIRGKAAEVTGISKLYSSPELAVMFNEQEIAERKRKEQFEVNMKIGTQIASITGDWTGLQEGLASGDPTGFIERSKPALARAQQMEQESKDLAKRLAEANINKAEYDITTGRKLDEAQQRASIASTQASTTLTNFKIKNEQAEIDKKAREERDSKTLTFGYLNDIGNILQNSGVDIKDVYATTPESAEKVLNSLMNSENTPGSYLYNINRAAMQGDTVAKNIQKDLENKKKIFEGVAKGDTHSKQRLEAEAAIGKAKQEIAIMDAFDNLDPKVRELAYMYKATGTQMSAELQRALNAQFMGKSLTTDQKNALNQANNNVNKTATANPAFTAEALKANVPVDPLVVSQQVASNPDYFKSEDNLKGTINAFESHAKVVDTMLIGGIVKIENGKLVPTNPALFNSSRENMKKLEAINKTMQNFTILKGSSQIVDKTYKDWGM